MPRLSALILLTFVILAPALAMAGPQVPQARLAAVGDVIFGRYLRHPGTGEPVYVPVSRAPDPFIEVAPLLRRADVAFANLETPVMAEPRNLPALMSGAFTFRADPDRVRLLGGAGVRVLSLANNHVTNLGTAGAAETREHVLAGGLVPVGAGEDPDQAYQAVLVKAGGLRLAIMAFTAWNGDHPSVGPDGAVAYVTVPDLLHWGPRAVQKVRQDLQADWVVVSLHWGEEYAPHPGALQRQAAHALIDAGADVVLGHHPHVLQDFERYRGGVIAYSLGNFLFDNPGLSRRQSAILLCTLSGRGSGREVREVSLVPVLAGAADFVPRPAGGADYRELAGKLLEIAPDFHLAPDPIQALQARTGP